MAVRNPAGQFGNSQFVVDPTLGVGSHTTITAALAASASGDTIYIRPGTYTENLTANMAGKSIIGAAVGTNAFEVQVVGNHVFDTNASTCAFQSIGFSASSGVCWTVGSSGAGNSSLYLEGCQVANSVGTGIQITSAGGTGSLQAFFTSVTGSTNGMSLANGTARLEGGSVTGTTGNAVIVGASMTVNSVNQSFSAPANDCISVTSATGVFNSEICDYTTSDSAFHFTSDGTISSISDTVNSSNGTGLFVDSTGAFGNLDYAALILTGSAKSIDSQVNAVALSVISSSGMVTEDITLSQTLESNHNYFVTASALSLLLPAMSTAGDTIEVTLAGGTSWVITQGAGQQIFIGSTNTTLGAGGSLASTGAGDSITLRCQAADLTWYVQSVIGNLTVI